MAMLDDATSASVPLRQPVGGPAARWTRSMAQFARHKPLGAVCGLIVLLLILTGLFGKFLAPHSYDDIDLTNRFSGPSSAHFFGTDDQGRDVFSRVIYGAQTSILIGFGAVALALLISTTLGVLTGYYGRTVDLIVQRFIDIWMAFPGLIFIIFVVGILGNTKLSLILTMGFLFSAGSSRVVRSVAISLKHQPFIEAARSLGGNDVHIVLRHIVPNVLPVVIITATVQIGAVILVESSLSFLGFGVPPPFPSWGRMLQSAQKDMQYHPYLAFFPGFAIALVVYSFNMFGDALRDELDPRMRGSK